MDNGAQIIALRVIQREILPETYSTTSYQGCTVVNSGNHPIHSHRQPLMPESKRTYIKGAWDSN
eukprot:6487889-Amphidinium_carterae.1